MDEARRSVPVRRHGGPARDDADWVAVEEPLQVVVHFDAGDAADSADLASAAPLDLLVTMRTPGHDAELVRGLLLGEGLVDAAADIRAVEPEGDAGRAIRVTVRAALRERFGAAARQVRASAACGVCGTPALGSAAVERIDAPFPVSAARLAALPAALLERQPAFASTGGLHAAALFAADGTLYAVREDVGRHNAVDKLVGAAMIGGRLPLADLGIVVSGRVSWEIIAKAARAGCPMVCAVGAPTSLAVEAAWEAGITLAGFLRDGRFNVYATPGRVAAGP